MISKKMNLKSKAHRNFFYLIFICFSCINNNSVIEYKNFNSGWEANDKAQFMISSFSGEAVNFILHIRNNNNYAFSNIFLIASVEVDGELFSRDTLEYELANSKGEWLGDGFTEVKESRLWWKEDFIVPKGKQINVIIEHAVRSNGIEGGIKNLEGIIGVGLLTEKINLN